MTSKTPLLELCISLQTISELNSREHWSKKHKLHKKQQLLTRFALQNHAKRAITLPCRVVLTRLSSRLLDDDNLVGAFKYIRDEVAFFLFPEKSYYIQNKGKQVLMKGLADDDKRVTWEYEQKKNKGEQQVQIQIFPTEETTTRCIMGGWN